MITLSHTKKPTRKEAFDLACKAKTHHLTESEIDSLINYFAPSVPSSPKTAFQWVARATLQHTPHRPQFVHVSDGVMYATDGHRLHWANTDLPNGYYDAKTGLPAKCDSKFPDVRRVIPKLEQMQKFEGAPIASARYMNRKEKHTLSYGGLEFDRDYVNDANPTDVHLDTQKMRGSNIFGEFVIMSMRA